MSIIIKSGNSGDLATVKSANLSATGSDTSTVITVHPNTLPMPITSATQAIGVTGSIGVVGAVVVTGPIAIASGATVEVGNFPLVQVVTGYVGVTGVVAELNVPTVQYVQGLGTSGVPTGGVFSVQGTTGGYPLPVTGAVGVNNFPSAFGVSGTVAVTGPVAVTGNFQATTQIVTGYVGVTGAVQVSNLPATQSVVGTVAVTGPVAITGSVGVTGSFFPTTQIVTGYVGVTGAVQVTNVVAVTGALSETNLPTIQYIQGLGTSGVPTGGVISVQGTTGGFPLPVTGAVSVNNFPATQGVVGTISVTGPVTVSNVVAVTGAIAPTIQIVTGYVGVTGSVGVNNFPATQGVVGTISVTGPVSVSNVVAVTGAYVGITGAVQVSNFPAVQVVTGPINIGNIPTVQFMQGVGTGGLPTGGVISVQGTTGGYPFPVTEVDNLSSNSYPDPIGAYVSGTTAPSIDPFGNLQIRGPVLSDEGSLRDDFSGTSLTTTLTGTLGFTNGSTVVTGSGTSFTTQVAIGQWIKKSADAETLYAQVLTINSNTSLTLATNYGGTTASGVAGVVSNWATVTPAGGSWAVASSILTLTAGTTASAVGSIASLADYPPYSVQFYAAISQRIANQTFYMGVEDVVGAPNMQATVQFTGTSNTQVNFVTSADNSSSIQTQTVTLPNGGVTSSYHSYNISLSNNQATLIIDGVVACTNLLHLPTPYQVLTVCAGVINGGTAPASSTTLTIDMAFLENVDRVQVDNDFTGEPLPTQIVVPTSVNPVGRLPVTLGDPGTEDIFGQVVTSQRLAQVSANFSTTAPGNLTTITTSGSATASGPTTGAATFASGTTAASEVKAVSNSTVGYQAHYEVYAAFTASFTAGITTSYQRIGLYNTTDGFSFGYNNATFGLWLRFNSVDTFIAQTAWNIDPLNGSPTSKFTSNGVPVSLVTTNINFYRIRFGWLGIAPAVFEVLSPDGNFVIVHEFRAPNSQTTVTLTNPNLPLTLDISNTTGGSSLSVTTGCWVAGVSVATTPAYTGVGSIAANGASVTIPIQGVSSLGFSISGTWSGTIAFNYSFDGVNFFSDVVLDYNTNSFVSTTTTNQHYTTACAAYKVYQIIFTSYVSGTAVITYNAESGATVLKTQTLITDASNNGPASVAPASTAATTTQPALVTALSPNSTLYDSFGNPIMVKNRVAIPTTQGIQPVSGIDAGLINRAVRVAEHGTFRTTSETLAWHDALEGTTVNAFYTQSTTTQTIAQTTGVLTLNSSGITTLNTDSIITTQRQFAKLPKVPLHWRMRANISANVASNHTLVEMGFGAPSGVTATISTGCFFRWTAAGVLNAVISFNGTEASTQLLAQGTISTTSYYRYDIFLEDEFARFIVTDNNDVPVVDTQVQLGLTVSNSFSVSHLPSFARVYVDATGGGTVIKLNIAAHDVFFIDVVSNKPWQQQMAAVMRHATINPTTYAQTPSSMTAAPATETPSNTVAGYATLGGDYAVALTVASENPLSVFAFTIPSPYSLYITQIAFSLPFVTTTIGVTGTPILEWLGIANCASGNISTGGGQRFPLGINFVYTSATQAAGSFLTAGGSLVFNPDVPIVCLPGTVLHLAYKVFITSAAGTPGVTRGSIYVDGYFE